MAIRVQTEAFDPGVEVNALHTANAGVGAVVSFVGYVRDFNDGRDVAGMFLEHYPGMTSEKALGKIVMEAEQRWRCSSECCTAWAPCNRESPSSLWASPAPIGKRRSTRVPL